MNFTSLPKYKHRLLFFSPYFYPYISGITTYPKLLFSQLSSEYEVTVLTFKHDKSLPSIEIIDGVKVVRMQYLFRISKGFVSPQSLIYFLKEMYCANVLVVNLPNIEGTALVFLAKILRKPSLGFYHCQVALESTLFRRIISEI